MPKLKIKTSRIAALTVTRQAIKHEKLVYVIRSNRRVKYHHGRSSVLYVGMTSVGAKRFAHSAVTKAQDILKTYGFKKVIVSTMTCTRLAGKASWPMLERAFIIKFREIYGSVPKFNKSFRNAKWRKERKYFNQMTLENIIREFESCDDA